MNQLADYLRHCYDRAYRGFADELRGLTVHVLENRKQKTTMRAQPVFNHHFWNRRKRAYKIQYMPDICCTSGYALEELEEDVLTGWFAHELGHVLDYRDRSGWNLLGFGWNYLWSPTFRIGAERRADVYAIEAGYIDEILATKKYILKHSPLPDYYIERIEKYYLSPEEAALLAKTPLPPAAKMDKLGPTVME